MWMVPRILFRPMPCFIAVMNSMMSRPRVPRRSLRRRILSLSGTVRTLTTPIFIPVGNRAVKVFEGIVRDVVGDVFLPSSVSFNPTAQPGLSEGRQGSRSSPRESLHPAKESVHRRYQLVRSGMRKLSGRRPSRRR